jgi:transcription initiation factor TFIIIB Brf1 subunit/transcription initiation factor TFIIB
VPFCPSCGVEYREGVTLCADCGVGLSEAPPPDAQPVEWMTVEETGDEAEAAIVEGFLFEQGITVRVLSHHDREFPTTIGALSTVEVQVPLDDLDRALEILEALDADGAVVDGNGEEVGDD